MGIEYIKGPAAGRFAYLTTSKTEDILSSGPITGVKESAYGWLQRSMVGYYGTSPASTLDVYEDIFKPRGLSFTDTETLLKNAVKSGFLTRVALRKV